MAELMQSTIDSAMPADSIPTLNTRAATLERDRTKISGERAKVEGEQTALNEKAVTAARERAKAAEPHIKAMQDAKPPDAKLELEKMPDYKRPTVDPKEFQETFSTLLAMSMMVGLATRTPFYGAMQAMTGAMNGYAKGDQQVVKESMDAFDKNYKAVTERNAARKAEYESVWNKWKNDMPEMERQLKLSMYKFDDEDALRATQGKVVGDKLKYLAQREAGIDKSLDGITKKMGDMESRRQHEETLRQANADRNQRAADAAADRRQRSEDSGRSASDRRTFQDSLALGRRYEQQIAPYSDLGRKVDRALAMLDENTPASKIIVQGVLSELTKGQRTNLQVKMTDNFGDLGTRIAGSFDRFVEGKWAPQQAGDLKKMLTTLRETEVMLPIARVRNQYRQLAEQEGLRSDVVTSATFGGADTEAAPAARTPAPAAPTATGPDGKKIMFKDGKWQPMTQ